MTQYTWWVYEWIRGAIGTPYFPLFYSNILVFIKFRDHYICWSITRFIVNFNACPPIHMGLETIGQMMGVPKVLRIPYLSRGILTMNSTRNQIVTNQIVRAYLNTGHVFLKTRSEQDSFAFDMHSTLLYDERSLQTMPLLKQSANHRFTQDGLLILAPCLVSCLPV